jgi:hypothetical protein
VVCPCTSDCSSELGLGRELRGLGWGFYRHEGRMAAWHEPLGKVRPGGKTEGIAASLAPAGVRRGATSARVRRKPPRGGFLRGRARFCGPAEDLQVLAGPLGRAASAAPVCAGQLACRRRDKAVGGERREKMMGLMHRKQKLRGPG